MILRSFSFAAALVAVTVVFGIEDTKRNRLAQAQRYLDVTPPREMVADIANQMSQGYTAQNRQVFVKTMTEELDVDTLTDSMTVAMVKTFTADELSALADFYGSPVGKSAMKKFGTYMAEVMPFVQGEVLRVSRLIDDQIEAEEAPPE